MTVVVIGDVRVIVLDWVVPVLMGMRLAGASRMAMLVVFVVNVIVRMNQRLVTVRMPVAGAR